MSDDGTVQSVRRLWVHYKQELQAYLDLDVELIGAVHGQDRMAVAAALIALEVQGDRNKRTEDALDDLLGVPHDEP